MGLMKSLVIDGNNVACQAIGKAPLTHNGQRTEVIKIALAMIRSYAERFQPHHIIVAWDGGRDERRKRLYPDYKARKRPMTEQEKADREILFSQMRELTSLLSALGVEQFKLIGREGDDVIYNLLRQDWAVGDERIVISTDRDMFHLLNYFDDVVVYSPIKKRLYDRATFEAEHGLPVTQFSLYRALVGDAGDNLPGIRGIGPKRATALIEQLCSDQITAGQKERLLAKAVKNEDELAVQIVLTELMMIPEEEMAEGFIGAKDMANVEERALEFSERFGFENVLNNLTYWLNPFVEVWLRRRK